MAPVLNIRADSYIRDLRLEGGDSIVISDCIRNYSGLGMSFPERILYRIVNAVKIIFCMKSDWQAAAKILENHILRRVDNLYQKDPQNETERKIKKEILDEAKELSRLLLKNCYLRQIATFNSPLTMDSGVRSLESTAKLWRDLQGLSQMAANLGNMRRRLAL